MSALEDNLAFQIKTLKLPTPVRELRFAPPRRWRLDFAWPERMAAVEVDGGTWTAGRHVRGKAFEADCEKHAEALLAGWSVLRVTGDMVTDGRAISLVERLVGP